MAHFPLWYRLDGRERYLIWIGGEKDYVAAEPSGFIAGFRDLATLHTYADLNHFSMESEEPALHDLDWAAAWCLKTALPIDCSVALSCWNLFSAVAASVGDIANEFRSVGEAAQATYQKLFLSQAAEWTEEERHELATVLFLGLRLFRESTIEWRRA